MIVKKELDPIFETFSLLLFANMDSWREETIEQLTEYGLGGETFFQKHLKIVEKYIRTFKKYRVGGEQEEFLCRSQSDNIYLLLLTLAVENREYLEKPQDLQAGKLRQMAAYCIADAKVENGTKRMEDMPDLSEDSQILDFIDQLDIKAEEKWYVLEILREPVQCMEALMELIRRNLPAFEKAREAVSKPLEKLLARKTVVEENKYFKMAQNYAEGQEIFISLAMPMVQIFFLSYGYQGILMEHLNGKKSAEDYPKDLVTRQAKALSDRSKLDILCHLKIAPKFNLELAQSMGLSPSTVSHHMNSLLICDFVTVEKRDGKVYYCLQKENIRNFLTGVEEMLL